MRDMILTALNWLGQAVLTALIVGFWLWWRLPSIPGPPTPAPPPQPEPAPPSYPPEMAIVKVVMSGGYCSGTIVKPQRPDKRWHCVSASHCFSKTGEKVRIQFRDGKSFAAEVIAVNRKSDVAILLTEPIHEPIPCVGIATQTPEVGAKVWHAGFGFDQPGNHEEGEFLGGPDSNGQNRYWLNVSNGDSGGGILLASENKLLSPVCCTTRIAKPATVWGAAPEVLHQMLAKPTSFEEIPPKPMPIREEK